MQTNIILYYTLMTLLLQNHLIGIVQLDVAFSDDQISSRASPSAKTEDPCPLQASPLGLAAFLLGLCVHPNKPVWHILPLRSRASFLTLSWPGFLRLILTPWGSSVATLMAIPLCTYLYIHITTYYHSTYCMYSSSDLLVPCT